VEEAFGSLAADPLRGKPLKGELRHLRSLRVGVYRLIYRYHASRKVVTLQTVRHRSEAYR
jgi:mRNA-degrading endonuclease RelE of RelBE toxin-antitoxin system